jgi:hypothetical protein
MYILCKYFTFSHVRGIEQKQDNNKQTNKQADKKQHVCVCAIITYYQHTGRVENKHVSR